MRTLTRLGMIGSVVTVMLLPRTVGAQAINPNPGAAGEVSCDPTVKRSGLDQAAAALKAGDYATAVRELRPLAEQGDPWAQGYLAVLYAHGHGVPQDDTEAAKWYRRAAEQGHAVGQYQLGLYYAEGRGGVPRDDTQAVKWYRQAADQGVASAQTNLGFMYAEGRGVQQDDTEAAKWYRRAADQGQALAQLNLGGLYLAGRGVPQDFVLAHMWSNLAAAQLTGDKRDHAVRVRDFLARRMTDVQWAEAQRRAREWKPRPE